MTSSRSVALVLERLKHPQTATALLNGMLYNAGWFACVLGAANDMPALGAIGGFLLIVAHLFCCIDPADEAIYLVAVAVLSVFVVAAFRREHARQTQAVHRRTPEAGRNVVDEAELERRTDELREERLAALGQVKRD